MKSQKFCHRCENEVRCKMKEDGYLELKGWFHMGHGRTNEMRELTEETRRG